MTGINRMQGPLRSLFVYEYVSGGGLAGESLPPSWLTEGRAMLRALTADLALCPAYTITTTQDAVWAIGQPPWADPRVRVVSIGPGEEQARFLELAAQADATIVIAPETGGILAERARWVQQAGSITLGASPDAIAIAGHKLRTSELLTSLGVPCAQARSFDPARGLVTETVWPIVIKPIDGAGSLDTIVVESADRVPAWCFERHDLIYQPFLLGTPLAASYIVRPKGRIELVGMARQRVERREGRLGYFGGTVPIEPVPPDETLRRAIGGIPGLAGWIGIDFIANESTGDASILEINPRLTTSYLGLRHLWPPGVLARRWVEGVLDPEALPLEPPVFHVPVTFASDGAVQRAWIGLDIGGANLKAAHTAGEARIIPFELWKRPDELPRVLSLLVASLPPADRIALTMTAELCDCYETKAEGVTEVLGAVLHVAEQRLIRVWGIDGRFHGIAEVLAKPHIAAAANWLALASLAARLGPRGRPGFLIDIGTTTCDLIPLEFGRPVPRGTTDVDRLALGELVYVGTRRTPVCALVHKVPFRGRPTAVAAELFATILDVYLTLEAIPEDPLDDLTADGRPATRSAARDRLARMIGADRSGFTNADAIEMARAVDQALFDRLKEAAEEARHALSGPPQWAVIAGSGEFLARRLADHLIPHYGRVIRLQDAWGQVASNAGCAYSLVQLALEADSPADDEPDIDES